MKKRWCMLVVLMGLSGCSVQSPEQDPEIARLESEKRARQQELSLARVHAEDLAESLELISSLQQTNRVLLAEVERLQAEVEEQDVTITQAEHFFQMLQKQNARRALNKIEPAHPAAQSTKKAPVKRSLQAEFADFIEKPVSMSALFPIEVYNIRVKKLQEPDYFGRYEIRFDAHNLTRTTKLLSVQYATRADIPHTMWNEGKAIFRILPGDRETGLTVYMRQRPESLTIDSNRRSKEFGISIR